MELRQYQREAIDSLRAELKSGKRRLVLYSPTGSGKTEMAISIIKAAEALNKRTLFIANRIQLVGQASRRLMKSGVKHGVVQGQNSSWTTSRILVCSIQTLASRGFPEDIDLIVIDEAHGVPGSEAYKNLLKEAQVPVVGLTATPFSRGMGRYVDELKGPIFETIVEAASIRDLIGLGFLVDCDIYAPSEPDLTGVKITAGDYNEKQLGERVNTTVLVGDIIDHWKKLANDSQTVCFATNIAHSKHIMSEFLKASISCEHIDCYTDDDERAAILRRLERGDTRVVCNVGVLAEGWDCPSVSTMILARPTKSLVRFIQMCGRVLRPHPGKEKALILDHAGATVRLGFPTDDLPLELDDGKPKEVQEKPPWEEEEEPLPKACPQCFAIKPPKTLTCPKCGFTPVIPHKVKTEAGKLTKLARSKATTETKQDVWSQLYGHAKSKGYKTGWAAHKYREYFGVWPRGLIDIPKPMGQHVKDYLTHLNIKHARGHHA